jgi:hypothetical protein
MSRRAWWMIGIGAFGVAICFAAGQERAKHGYSVLFWVLVSPVIVLTAWVWTDRLLWKGRHSRFFRPFRDEPYWWER